MFDLFSPVWCFCMDICECRCVLFLSIKAYNSDNIVTLRLWFTCCDIATYQNVIYLFIYSFIHSLTHSLTHSFILIFTQSFIYLFIRVFITCCSRSRERFNWQRSCGRNSRRLHNQPYLSFLAQQTSGRSHVVYVAPQWRYGNSERGWR